MSLPVKSFRWSWLTAISLLILSTVVHSSVNSPKSWRHRVEARGIRRLSEIGQFVDRLPIPPSIKIPPSGEFTIPLRAFSIKINRDLPPSPAFGYGGMSPGPTIEVEAGHPIRVHFKNELPLQHFFPSPKGSEMNSNLPDVRAITHLHGAVVTSQDPLNRLHNNDGWPDAWNIPGQEQIADYPNVQTARTLFYHDHAMGTTGRNVAAGLAGMYIIHDALERSLHLPRGPFEIPLFFESQSIVENGTRAYTDVISNEFYGNVVSVNGKIVPFLNVEPRKYRFRMVNAMNARSLGIKLVDAGNSDVPGPAFYQIGSDAGFLQQTVKLNDPADPKSLELNLAPSERADVIIDFSAYAGRSFILFNDSITDPDGEIPDFRIMRFNVAKIASSRDVSQIPGNIVPIRRMNPAEANHTRQIFLNAMKMPGGFDMYTINGKLWRDPVTERIPLGSTEIWEVINTTPKLLHPFHVHLEQFQILDRTPFDLEEYKKSGQVKPTGPSFLPDPNEMGWKDTVRANPGQITRIIMRFGPYPGSYVYHCHILEHEDMDMMRPLEIF